MSDIQIIHTPSVRRLSRHGQSVEEYLARIARISRGIDPFDPVAHADDAKNQRTVTHCWRRGHRSIFEFWPYYGPFSLFAGSDRPGSYQDQSRRHIWTLAHADGYPAVYTVPPLSWHDYPCMYIECSRITLAQLTRYRYWFSVNVESQRYVRYGQTRPYSVYIDPQARAPARVEAMAEAGYSAYREALHEGELPEIARGYLSPWTTTRLAMAAPRQRWEHFLRQRLDGATGTPQGEIRNIAQQVSDLLEG